ncbi:kinetochore Sim4 complex subunit FTA2-domain-containing protein [Fusarium avenaceum]|nr:kinetochore Sim4 complex subunit FTA2-domain-containing protein [Fusarium avenaceum]
MPKLEPLPPCPGPKLEAFTDDITKHNLKIIQEVGAGCHSAVWRVELDGKLYAIKIFNHGGTLSTEYNPGGYFCEGYHFEEPPQPSESLPQSAIDSLLLDSSSFYNECRVFGRLKELGREDLAIKVYGYIRLDLQDKRVRQPFVDYYNSFKSVFGDKASGENAEKFEKEFIERMVHQAPYDIPAFGIVKEFIPEPPMVLSHKASRQRTVKQLPRLLKNLHNIHKAGIVIQDLKPCQYIDGHLTDFSHAWTIPHTYGPEGGLRPRWMFESMAAWDLHCFQEMIDEERYVNEDFGLDIKMPSVRAVSNQEVLGRLRPRAQTYGPLLPFLAYDLEVTKLRTHDPKFDPGLFDWRAAQKKSSKKPAEHVTKRKAATGRVTKRKASNGRGKQRKAKKGKKTEGEDVGGE